MVWSEACLWWIRVLPLRFRWGEKHSDGWLEEYRENWSILGSPDTEQF